MFSFGQAATSGTPGNAAQSAWGQQQQGQQQQQPQPQPQQQQQPGAFGSAQMFGSANPLGQSTALTLGDLTRSQQQQQQQQQQQLYHTPGQQQQQNAFGAAPSVSTPFSTPSATTPNQQAGAGKFPLWGGTNVGNSTTTAGSFGSAQHFAFGAPGGGAEQSYLQQQQLQQQQAQLQMQQHQQQQAQQQAQQQQMNYMPGYLSKLKSARPYTSPSRVVEPASPTQNQQADASRDGGASGGLGVGSGIGLGASTSGGLDGLESTSSPGAARFSSSFFSLSSPERDTHASRDQRSSTPAGGSIFGPSGLRGSRRTPLVRGGSIGPGGASASGGGADLGSSLGRKVSSGGRMRAPSTSPKMIHSGSQSRFAASTAGGMDDDDAPPVEGLMDVGGESNVGDVSFASSDGGLLRSSLASPQHMAGGGGVGRKSSVFFAATTSTTRGGALSPSPSALAPDDGFGGSSAPQGEAARTIIVFGYPSALSTAVVDHFRSMGDVSSIHFEKSLASLGLESVKLTYAQPWMALRAIRRNGEALNIAGASAEGSPSTGIMVGVRWADDAMHREQVQSGINSPAFSLGLGIGAGGGVGITSSNGAASSTNGNNGDTSLSRPHGATGTGAGGARHRTPAFGRPISIVGSPASAFAPSSKRGGTPFGSSTGPASSASAATSSSPIPSLLKGARNSIFGAPPPAQAQSSTAAQNQQQQQQQQQQQPNGVIGRLGDAIFGW